MKTSVSLIVLALLFAGCYTEMIITVSSYEPVEYPDPDPPPPPPPPPPPGPPEPIPTPPDPSPPPHRESGPRRDIDRHVTSPRERGTETATSPTRDSGTTQRRDGAPDRTERNRNR